MVTVLGEIPDQARSIGILAGAFNPPTRAHQALLAAARARLDAVVCAVPREYPHKTWHGATLEERTDMLRTLGYPVARTTGGLFIAMARELQPLLGSHVQLYFLCGRDAAERIAGWDYEAAGVAPIAEQLREYRLLVARREREYEPPAELRWGVETLDLEPGWDEISSTAIRDDLARGGSAWREWVPAEIAADVERIYR